MYEIQRIDCREEGRWSGIQKLIEYYELCSNYGDAYRPPHEEPSLSSLSEIYIARDDFYSGEIE